MENYIKEQDFIEINDDDKQLQLMQSILRTQRDIQQAHINFEYAEEELIDFYSYQIKANQSKLDYLTRLAKSKNLENPIKNNISA